MNGVCEDLLICFLSAMFSGEICTSALTFSEDIKAMLFYESYEDGDKYTCEMYSCLHVLGAVHALFLVPETTGDRHASSTEMIWGAVSYSQGVTGGAGRVEGGAPADAGDSFPREKAEAAEVMQVTGDGCPAWGLQALFRKAWTASISSAPCFICVSFLP